MRRSVAFILLGVAGFFLTTALLTQLVVPGMVKKTPLDVHSDTRLTGQAYALPDGSSGPVKAISRTIADSAASDGAVVVFDNFSCVIKDPDGTAPDCVDAEDGEKRLVTAGSDRFATERFSAVAVNDEKYVGAGAEPHEGLINKFPFDVEQKSYQFWDGLLGRTVEAKYEAAEEIDGVAVNRYHVVLTDEQAEIASGVQGTYSDDKTMWIDQATGSIINQTERQVRRLPDGTTVLDLELKFTDATVAANVTDASANGSQLRLVGVAPVVCWVVGLLSLLGGLFFLRRTAEQTAPAKPAPAKVA